MKCLNQILYYKTVNHSFIVSSILMKPAAQQLKLKP